MLSEPLCLLANLVVLVGQIFAATVAPESIRSSMQALIFAATTGVGLFLGCTFVLLWAERAVLAGFYSYGEISPFTPGAKCELHNQTMTVTTFLET